MADAIDILINATDKASPAINTVKSSLGGMNDNAKESHSVFSSFGSLMTGGLTVALTAGAAAVGGLVFAFRDSADIAREHIQVEKQLEAVLKSTGGAAGVTSEMANKLADSMQQVTNFDGEAVLGGENLLLTFTNIGKDVFPRATESMLDMSQALGQDMKSSAVQLGKALNDPIAGISALSRVGVTFTDQQKEQITTMVEAGNVAGAQGLILDELAKEFGGSARAMVEPGKQLANMWGDVKEQVGMFLIPIFDDLAKRAMPILSAATDYLSGLVGIFNDHLSKGGSYAEAFGAVIKSVLPVIKDWTAAMWKWVVDSIPIVLQKLTNWGGEIVTWLVHALPRFIATFLEWETALYQWIDDTLPKAIESLANFIRGLRGEGDGAGSNQLGGMASGWADKLWRWITEELIPAVKPAFLRFIETMGHLGLDLLRALADLAKEMGLTLWKWIVDVTPVALRALADWGGKLWDWVKQNAPAWKDVLLEWAGYAWKWITDTAIPAALEQIAKWGAQLWEWVKDNAPKWRDNLADWAKAAWEWITKEAIPTALEKLKEWGQSIVQWVQDNWPKWRDSLLEAGRNIVEGLRKGIEEKKDDFLNWWNNFGPIRLLISATTSLLGIASPSRLFWGFGQDVVAGLVGGVDQDMGRTRDAGAAMAHGLGDGLKSEAQYVADQIKSTMDLANATLQGQIDTITRQAAVQAQQSYLKAVKDQAINPANIAQLLGIDPKLLPPSMGGTGNVIGIAPGGGLIIGPAGGNTPTPNITPATTPTTNTIGALIGGNTNVNTTNQGLLGGINLTTPDIKSAKDSAKEAAAKVKDFIAGLGDFFSDTLDNTKVNAVFSGLAMDKNNNAIGLGELRGASDTIRQKMAALLGLSQIYGSLTANLPLVLKKISAGTDPSKVADLLQSAVDFRTLANYYDAKDQYGNPLPTDKRLTGDNNSNTYTINLNGSNNANADVLGLMQLLGSLQNSATP